MQILVMVVSAILSLVVPLNLATVSGVGNGVYVHEGASYANESKDLQRPNGASTGPNRVGARQTVDDQTQPSANDIPENPGQQLPTKVSANIPDDASVVSKNLAVLKNGTAKDLTTGATVTDMKTVGTPSTPPDPLAKTNGKSFIPVDAGVVRDAVTNAQQSSEPSAQREGVSAHVRSVALMNNQYGAHWGSYTGSQAFFEQQGGLFAQQAKGVVDVSQWQGDVDWSKAEAAGVQGAIIRIGYGWGNGIDSSAVRNINECKRLGIPFGIYLYSYAENSGNAASEGDDVVAKLRQAGVQPGDLAYPVFYDLEDWAWSGHAHPTNPGVYEGIVNAWYAQLQRAGFSNLSVYSYASYLSDELNSASIHARTRWVASYGPRPGFNYPTNDRGWQYSSQGVVNGIAGYVDLNAFGNLNYQASINVPGYQALTIPNGEYYINAMARDSASVDMPGGGRGNGVRPQLYRANGTGAQRYRFTRQGNGSYVITNVNSGKVLDVSVAVAGDGAVVQQWDANGTSAQQWYLRDSGAGYYLQSALGNWVLDLAAGSVADGTSVRLFSPNGTMAQRFLVASTVAMPVDTTVEIAASNNQNLAMDMPGASRSDGTAVQLYPWNQTDAQLYRLHAVGNGIYSVINAVSGKAIEVAGASTANGASICQWTSNNTPAQHWSVLNYEGSVALVNGASGKAVDVPGGNAVANAHPQLYGLNGTGAQRWIISSHDSVRVQLDRQAAQHRSDLANGSYVVKSAMRQSMVADVAGGSISNSAEVRLWRANGTAAQTWRVMHDEQGYVTLINARSGKALDVAGGNASNGARVQQYDSNGSYAQKWIAVYEQGGAVTLRSALGLDLALDVAGGSTQNGARMQLYATNGTAAQQWVFRR
ncbi:RICIN domain-containing protein [Bifidobacterium mongoliense]|uniref:RICIN domain-containing protein n=1 Tax=Bifidobacterium mongoliense TaxID=518643 RepID=UPI00264A2D2B|nr:RICIN domain-containing protein [Bifidobacterium mongoliense]MDN6024623.1 RICIN domain-containing protein [Bifidobacterium mongoliense]